MNHAVNIVGYNDGVEEDEKPYWIVRNSWGTEWGIQGYMKMAITDGIGVCGIQSQVSFPNVYLVKPFNQAVLLTMGILGVLSPVFAFIRLFMVKRNSGFKILNDGILGMTWPLIGELLVFATILLLSTSAYSPTTKQYQILLTGFYLAYGFVHAFLLV